MTDALSTANWLICDDGTRFASVDRVWIRSAPDDDDGGEREDEVIVAGQLVVPAGKTTDAVDAEEGSLDAPVFAVARLFLAALVISNIVIHIALAENPSRACRRLNGLARFAFSSL
ncbi:hypothetical protein FPV16_18455 [Methylobacterium sp. W2]|nr:hypothetical protein [Methylobacterium sp. W2]